MFPEFATVYRDDENKIHLYVFPGIDDNGKQIYRNMDLKNINAEYKYIKNDDKSYDFIFSDVNIKHIECSMIHSITGASKTFKFDNF